MSGRRKVFAIGLLTLFLGGIVLVGGGNDPDEHFAPSQHLATTLVFLCWAASAYGWGSVFARALRPTDPYPALELALGVGFYAVFGGAMGHLGLIGPGTQGLWVAMSCTGLLLFSNAKIPGFSQGFGRFSRTAVALVLASLALHVVKAQFPGGQSDPLFYHLYGPWRWAEEGIIHFIGDSPVAMLASYWEYLHFWPIRLLAFDSSHGLIEIQIFGQLSHLVLGWAGCALALYAFARRVLRASPAMSMACVLTGLTVRDLLWVATLSKNDWGSSLWLIVAVTEIHDRLMDPKRSGSRERLGLAVFGFMMGLAIGAKYTQVIVASMALATIGVMALRRGEGSARSPRVVLGRLVWAGSFAAIGLLPYLLRNALLTGDPLFPFFGHVFGIADRMNDDFLSLMDQYQGSGDHLQSLMSAPWSIFNILTREPVLIPSLLAFIAVPLSYAKLHEKSLWLGWAMMGWISLFLFILIGSQTEVRHFGVILVLLATLAPLALRDLAFLARLSIAHSERVSCAMALIAFVALGDLARAGNYEIHNVFGFVREAVTRPSADQAIREGIPFGVAKAWVRMKAEAGEPVVVSGNYQLYYLTGHRVAALHGSAEFNPIIRTAHAPEDVLLGLRKLGYRYLIEVENPHQRSSLSRSFDAIVARLPCMAVFGSPDARIIDLKWMDPGAPTRCPQSSPQPAPTPTG